MQRLITILVFLSLSFQSFIQFGVVSWYEINKAQISKTLCENRTRPKLQCNGKCYLSKQQKKTANTGEESEKPTETNPTIEIQPFIIPRTQTTVWIGSIASLEYFAKTRSFISSAYNRDPFHPPQS